MDRIKVACFGLQGFGNDMLAAVRDYPRAEITAIYTRQPTEGFDYYECQTIAALAAEMDVPLINVPSRGDWRCQAADLAIVSTFHRLFKAAHLSRFGHTVNIHPSLLPAYRGATPTNWMARNGEKIVGLTAHLVDTGIDTGTVLFQHRLLNPYLSDHRLRKALSFLTRDMAREILDRYPIFKKAPASDQTSSYYPLRSHQDAVLNLAELESIEELIWHIKAFTNVPMPKLVIRDRVFVIDYEHPRQHVEIEINNRRFNILGYWSDSESDRN